MKRLFETERWAAGLVLLLTPVYYVFPWGSAPAARFATGIPFLLVYAIVLPGYLLSLRIARRPSDVLEKITTAALLGIALFMALAFICALTHHSLRFLQMALPAVLAVGAAWSMFRPRARSAGTAFDLRRDMMDEVVTPLREAQDRDAASITGGDKVLVAAFAVFLALTFTLVLVGGLPLNFESDTLVHVAYVAEIAETLTLFPTTTFYADAGANGEDLRMGLFHVFYGFSSRYLHVDSMGVLAMMNAFLAVLMLLSVYTSAHILFRDRRVAVLSSFLFFAAVDKGLGGTAIRQSYSTSRFGIAFFLLVLAYGLSYIETGRRRHLAPAAVLAFGASAVHVFFGVLLVFAGLTTLVWKFCFRQSGWKDHLSRVFPLGIAVVCGILPYGLFRYATANPGGSELHRRIQGVMFITDRLYIPDPLRQYEWFGIVGVLSVLTIFALWNHRKRYAGLGYAFASYFTLGALVFNPILAPLLRSIMTYLIRRLNMLCPFYFVTAYFLVAFFSPGGRELRSGAFRRIVGVLMIVAVASTLVPLVRDNPFSRRGTERGRVSNVLMWKDALTAISVLLPKGSVIASDPITSYSVTAFTPYRTVCTLDQHAPPNDTLLAERIRAARDILSPYVPMDRTTALLADHKATHVIVNDRFPSDVRIDYWSMNHEMFPAIRDKFDSHPEAFERVYDKKGFVVFAWNGRQVEADSVLSTPFVLAVLPDEMTRVGKEAGEATLEGFTLREKDVSRGRPLDIALVWSGRGGYPLGNYLVSVRFDHADSGLPLGGQPFPKIERKMKEKLTGRSYRFSEFHKIRSGFLSPDAWRPGDLVLDETQVHVPSNAVPGEYIFSVKLLTVPHASSYWPKDFLSDDDLYAGLPVGRIRVR